MVVPGENSLKSFEIYVSDIGGSCLLLQKKFTSIKGETPMSKTQECFYLDKKKATSKTHVFLSFSILVPFVYYF